MQDLFDAHGRRNRPTEAAQAAFSEDSLGASDSPSSFASNITFPLKQIFQLVKNKKEAMVLLEVGRIGSLLDLETSRLMVDLQHRELLQNSANSLSLARDPKANALLPLLTETGRVNAKRLDLIWENINRLMAKLVEFRTNLRSFQELNAAVAQEFYAAGHVSLAQQKLLLARAEKLLIDKLEFVIDGSDPFGVSTDSWSILFPDLAPVSQPTTIISSGMNPIPINQTILSSTSSPTVTTLGSTSKSARHSAAGGAHDGLPRPNEESNGDTSEKGDLEPPEPKRRKVEFAEPVVQQPALAAPNAVEIKRPTHYQSPLKSAISNRKQDVHHDEDKMDLDESDAARFEALPSQDLRTKHGAKLQDMSDNNASQIHLLAPVKLSFGDGDDDDAPILTKPAPKPLPSLFGHSRVAHEEPPSSNSIGLVDYPLDGPSDEQ